MIAYVLGGAIGAVLILSIWGSLYWRERWLESYIMEEEEPDGPYNVILRKKSPYQKIAVAESDGIYHLYADGSEMLSTDKAEDQYAEAIVHIPMAAARNRESVLIIGSGAGITAREVLRYEEVESITAVDLDPLIVEMGRTFEPFVAFTRGSLNDPRVTTVLEDGRTFIETSNDRWNVIIIDLPDPSMQAPALNKLFSVEFYRLLKTRLHPGGAIAIACSVVSTSPEYLAAVRATLKTAGFSVAPYHWDYIVEFAVDWGFCLATLRPMDVLSLEPLVSVQHLSEERLEDMFRLPRYLRVEWDEDEVQTDKNTLLADILAGEFQDY
ncbi:Spermine synthase [Paenibacillus curdlanolyticus YK9]|uniref:Polyamine aminopropyltransferase n=1 Tax=Paenibacillus curdlanolyticus YK9 TaxID=717606 RepID=E0I9Y6_9BACL|nr:spermine synthase [Paenibacillus curdlanolyticus]EFM10563.1 Spermine synthase [Paenibacillus curdlanolyticus YK9]